MAISQIIIAKHDKGDLVASDLVAMEEVWVDVFLWRTKEYYSASFHKLVMGKGR